MENLLAALAPLVVFGGLFTCSLFACKTWISRALFTIVMPLVYGMLGFLCLVILGCIAMLMPSGIESILDALAIPITITACLTLFVIQMTAMSRDPAINPGVYIPKFSTMKSKDAPSALPHVVTQRRYMRH
jgi:hypothetical protein